MNKQQKIRSKKEELNSINPWFSHSWQVLALFILLQLSDLHFLFYTNQGKTESFGSQIIADDSLPTNDSDSGQYHPPRPPLVEDYNIALDFLIQSIFLFATEWSHKYSDTFSVLAACHAFEAVWVMLLIRDSGIMSAVDLQAG